MILDNLPVIISLVAGFIVCVAMFIYQYEGVGWLLIVLGTLIFFYILGACIKKLFKVVLVETEEIQELVDNTGDENDEDEEDIEQE